MCGGRREGGGKEKKDGEGGRMGRNRSYPGSENMELLYCISLFKKKRINDHFNDFIPNFQLIGHLGKRT